MKMLIVVDGPLRDIGCELFSPGRELEAERVLLEILPASQVVGASLMVAKAMLEAQVIVATPNPCLIPGQKKRPTGRVPG